MAKYGKGFTLALFFIFFLSQARGVPSQPIDATGVGATNAGTGGGFPVIMRMDRRDEGFRQYIADVEANRRLVFSRNRRQDITAGVIAEALTIYKYTVHEGDDLLSLAARSNIPFSTLATLNRLNNSTALQPGMVMLMPSVPGIFVPDDPESDLERLLSSSRFPATEGEWSVLTIPDAGGGRNVFHFFPGEEFTPPERAFFLNPGFFRFPLLNFRLTSGYGMRSCPMGGHPHFHRGVDLAAPTGTEIFAAADGVVTETGFDRILGYFVRISHARNWTTLYGHMQRIGTAAGTTVRAGTLIGWVGSTGYSTGPHLHFEMWQGNQTRDPSRYLRR
ncbi:MAG: M23 family metallopeptidase [Treponema sp.]|nr:M23 family metallopeptidase [Treponema sp.]